MKKFLCYIVGAIIAGIIMYYFGMNDDVPQSVANALALIALYRTCVKDHETEV